MLQAEGLLKRGVYLAQDRLGFGPLLLLAEAAGKVGRGDQSKRMLVSKHAPPPGVHLAVHSNCLGKLLAMSLVD